MLRKSGAIEIISVLLLLLFPQYTDAQILQDTTTLKLVRKDVSYIYGLQFDKAHELYDSIVLSYPKHPIVFLLKGMMTYWENYPMLHTSSSHISFENDMRECIKISEKNENPVYEAEYLLANLCARGMLLMYYDDNELIMEVTPLTISTYKYIRRAFDLTSVSVDLYYFTGLYNYFREAYPKAYPVYKSLAFLFPHGSTSKGLEQLQTVAGEAVVLKAESSILLIWIYLSFENNLDESSGYCKYLFENYPGNRFFRVMYIRNLLFSKNYSEAEKLILSSPDENSNQIFYKAQLTVLNGVLKEKKYHDLQQASQLYNEGIRELSKFGRYGNEFSAYGYFGLSRINEIDTGNHTHKTYRKEALKLAEFKKFTFDK
jgi:hypothetical protein